MEEIKILSQKYEILEVPVIEQGEALCGMVNHLENKIYLCSSLNEDKKRVVLLHETLHAVFEQLGFDEEHDNEHLINALSNSIYQILVDNPKLFSPFFSL